MYVKPTPLHEGDMVAIIAPSSPISSTEALLRAVPVFEECGLRVAWGRNVTNVNSDAWSAASIENRIEEVTWAFESEEFAAVWVAEGGFSSAELLPYMPYDLIRKSGKSFIGMSDVTALNNGILARAGLANFSAPNIRVRKGFDHDAESLAFAIKLLMCDAKWNDFPFRLTDKMPRCVCPGIVRGPVLGGNLTIFSCLVGTPYMPDCRGAVLFFEDVHAGGYEVAMAIGRLELSGILDQAAGVVFGEFCKIPDRSSEDLAIEDVIVRKFRDRMPCIYGMNFSHGQTCASIPLGCDCVVDAEARSVMFSNPFGE